MIIMKYFSLILEELPEVPVLDLDGSEIERIKLPPVFGLPIRIDLIRRAYHSAHTARLQPKGRDPLAGKRRCGESWGAGHSVARVPRLDTGRAVFAPMVRGGRLAHPPRVEKKIHEEINKKEMRLAIMSALAATAKPEFVKRRGHVVETKSVPVIVVDDLENISKTKELREILKRIGLWNDVIRAQERTRIRAGKGKMRGRRYITPRSFLLIVSTLDAPVIDAAFNLPGVDIATPQTLSILHLAPGGVPGRLTLITKKALNMLASKFEVLKP